MSRPLSEQSALRPLLSCLSELRNRHVLAQDTIALALTPALALLLRVESLRQFSGYFDALVVYTLVALIIRIVVFCCLGLYNRYWRYATVDELVQIVVAVVIATGLICLLFLIQQAIWNSTYLLPRSLPLLDGLLSLFVVGSTRFSARLAERWLRQPPRADARRVLVVGAGDAGRTIVKELQENPRLLMVPMGFLDEDARKQGTRILNLPVLGGLDRLPLVVRRHNVGQVIIALPHAPGRTIRDLLGLCENARVPAKTIPALSEILGGTVRVNHLRNVEIEDLLRREPVRTNIEAVEELIRGRRVLVTGAGGSIGSELCRQVLHCGPAELALVGHGENSVFEVQNELLRTLRRAAESDTPTGPTVLQSYIADIRFRTRLRSVVRDFAPDIIFHAAAHKHVPLMEQNPVEAVSNNIFGTRNLLEAALECDVERLVMISTDKAVNPTSIMGASKRAAELLVLRAAQLSRRAYGAVRFGNVLGSRGSVVLTFKRQIATGGPVTVSHPEMQRFFMTIPEAVQLLLQAAVLGRGGEIFMLDMGEPVKIVDLARDLIVLSGLEVDRDIEIVYTGIRPGEKLYEELFVPGETYQPTHHEKILIARNASSFVPEDRRADEVPGGCGGDQRRQSCCCLPPGAAPGVRPRRFTGAACGSRPRSRAAWRRAPNRGIRQQR